MNNEFRYMCLVETRRMLLLMGVVFGLFLFVQYFDLPYRNIYSPLFAPGKDSHESSSRNLTNFSNFNMSDSSIADGVHNTTEVPDEKDSNMTTVKDDVFHENDKSSNNTSNEDIDMEEESPSMSFSEMNHSSSIEREGTNSSSLSVSNPEKDTLPIHNGAGEINLVNSSGPVAKDRVKNSNPAKDRFKNSNPAKDRFKKSKTAVASISEMNDMLIHASALKWEMKPNWPSTADQELLDVRRLIENAPLIEKDPHFDVNLYRNFSAFKRSYELMDQTLKVYIYREGEQPIFHRPPLKGIYASEGWFMKLLKANKRYATKNPNKAHLFYLPFSSRMLEMTLYQPRHSRKNLVDYLDNYIQMIMTKYSFWNRTAGADHFLVACHDWAPYETRQIMANCIRAMCNADIKEGFEFGKDASLPETLVHTPRNPLRQLGGKSPSQRKIIAFFAGSMHGYLRPILLKHWENKDPEMKIFGQIPKRKGEMSYVQYMKSSKYCICARGFEVNSPRVVEAIFFECVPVIISDNFVPPFFETLNWESFAVFVLEKDIPNLKNILMSIPEKKYLSMQQRVKQVQQHFLWHTKPVKYDVFHMILHSIWHNRVFRTK